MCFRIESALRTDMLFFFMMLLSMGFTPMKKVEMIGNNMVLMLGCLLRLFMVAKSKISFKVICCPKSRRF